MGLPKIKEVPENDAGHNGTAQVKQLLVALNGTFKKLILYPPEHVIYQSSLESLKNNLDVFLDSQGALELIIDRNKIGYRDEVVHEGPMNEENLAFILFRDGIYGLQIQESIKKWEIHGFLEVLQKHQILTEDAENDIVTALWELELPSLSYQAEDVGFDTGEEFEIPELGGTESSEDIIGYLDKNAAGLEIAPSLQAPIYDQTLWELTPQDQVHLGNMLVEEEEWERIEYVLYILLYILQQQAKPGKFSGVMDYLVQELQDAMEAHHYHSVYNTLHILKKTAEAPESQAHWSIPLLENFFASLSGKAFLGVLQGDWDQIAKCDPQERAYLKKALLLLNADAIEALGPMLVEVDANQSKKLLMTVIGILAEREFEHLKRLLSSADTELVRMLVHIMGFMKSPQAIKQLLELLHHDVAGVRKEALIAIARRDADRVGELFWLVNDPDEDVQQLFLKYASQKRDAKTEKMLRKHLKKQRLRSDGKLLGFQLYRALGKCGSDESLPFLKKDLFLLPSLGLLRSKKSLRRQAAVHALKELNTENAGALLNRISI